MKNNLADLAIACVVVSVISGCGAGLPEPLKTPEGQRVEVLSLDRTDVEELAAVKAVESARFNYKYRLEILEAYYSRVGNVDKLVWARREIANLAGAQNFTWENQEVVLPEGESLDGADESILVEEAVKSRQDWLAELTRLAEYYQLKDDSFNHDLIENVKARLDPVYTYMYFLDVEIPPATLQPVEVSTESESLYEQAMQLKKESFWSFPAEQKRKRLEALLLLLKLVNEHPSSTKIALSAYEIANIYEKSFSEYVRSVHWYQRAWQWDPDIDKPARFRAAVVYDQYLRDKDKAVECYRMVLENEAFSSRNNHWAKIRIREITEPENQ